MAINPRLISKDNPYQFLPTPTHLKRGRKDYLCRLWDLLRCASSQNIMLSSDDCSVILNNTKRGHEKVATPRTVAKHMAYMFQKGVLDRYEFRSKEFSGWHGAKKAYYMPESGDGKWYRPDFPSFTRDEDGQWEVISSSKPTEERDIKAE